MKCKKCGEELIMPEGETNPDKGICFNCDVEELYSPEESVDFVNKMLDQTSYSLVFLKGIEIWVKKL